MPEVKNCDAQSATKSFVKLCLKNMGKVFRFIWADSDIRIPEAEFNEEGLRNLILEGKLKMTVQVDNATDNSTEPTTETTTTSNRTFVTDQGTMSYRFDFIDSVWNAFIAPQFRGGTVYGVAVDVKNQFLVIKYTDSEDNVTYGFPRWDADGGMSGLKVGGALEYDYYMSVTSPRNEFERVNTFYEIEGINEFDGLRQIEAEISDVTASGFTAKLTDGYGNDVVGMQSANFKLVDSDGAASSVSIDSVTETSDGLYDYDTDSDATGELLTTDGGVKIEMYNYNLPPTLI